MSESVRRILCFGDSNTWGSNPATRARFPADVRWTGVLAKTLGVKYEIIEEGLRGRSMVFDDPLLPHRNGSRYLAPCILSHQPIDAIVIMLGTNDLKNRFGVSAAEIAVGMKELVRIVRTIPLEGPSDKMPEILIVSPPMLGKRKPDFVAQFSGADEKSKGLGAAMAAMAAELKVPFLDVAPVVTTGDHDGVHFPPKEHAKLGKVVAQAVEKLFSAAKG
jgi:lysophospholipase L1-like esterase